MLHGTEEEGTFHVENFHAFRDVQLGGRAVSIIFLIIFQQFVFDGGNIADLGHAAHEEQGGQHHAYFHGYNEVHKHGQQEGDYQHRRILPGPFQQTAERVYFTHVVAHYRQNARQDSQGNLLGIVGKGHQNGQQGQGVNHTGNRAFSSSLDVSGGAGNGSGGRNAAKQGGSDVADTLCNQLHVGLVAPSGHAVRYGGA